MSKYKEPIGHTCPIIDEVISAIRAANWDDTYWGERDLIRSMEKIRDANGTLRDWGNELVLEIEMLNIEINKLQEKNENTLQK